MGKWNLPDATAARKRRKSGGSGRLRDETIYLDKEGNVIGNTQAQQERLANKKKSSSSSVSQGKVFAEQAYVKDGALYVPLKTTAEAENVGFSPSSFSRPFGRSSAVLGRTRTGNLIVFGSTGATSVPTLLEKSRSRQTWETIENPLYRPKKALPETISAREKILSKAPSERSIIDKARLGVGEAYTDYSKAESYVSKKVTAPAIDATGAIPYLKNIELGMSSGARLTGMQTPKGWPSGPEILVGLTRTGLEEARDRPILTIASYAAGYGLGKGAKILTKIVPTSARTKLLSEIGLGAAYVGIAGYGIAKSPTPKQTAYSELFGLATFSAGAKIGYGKPVFDLPKTPSRSLRSGEFRYLVKEGAFTRTEARSLFGNKGVRWYDQGVLATQNRARVALDTGYSFSVKPNVESATLYLRPGKKGIPVGSVFNDPGEFNIKSFGRPSGDRIQVRGRGVQKTSDVVQTQLYPKKTTGLRIVPDRLVPGTVRQPSSIQEALRASYKLPELTSPKDTGKVTIYAGRAYGEPVSVTVQRKPFVQTSFRDWEYAPKMRSPKLQRKSLKPDFGKGDPVLRSMRGRKYDILETQQPSRTSTSPNQKLFFSEGLKTKSDISLDLPKTRSVTNTRIKPDFKTGTGSRILFGLSTKNISAQYLLPSTTLEPRIATGLRIEQRPRQESSRDTLKRQRQSFKLGLATPTLSLQAPPSTQTIPGIKPPEENESRLFGGLSMPRGEKSLTPTLALPKLVRGGLSARTTKTKSVKTATAYKPSLEASLFNVKGRESKIAAFTGLGIRKIRRMRA